ncbi:hypothetical protein PINS_up014026 [Pythium insidiosum]|nr:hypothetical protein PINS_up014026 [Pythium insidiosum]
MFEWAGIGFSKGETFRLSVALNRLAVANGTTSLRFWGKILGVGADFYIAEGEVPGAADPEDPMAEEGTTGVNRFTYWAMKDDGAYEWVRLPNVRREHIHVARQLRRFVRANLDGKVRGRLVVLSSSSCHSSHTRGPSQVPGHPPFPGTERHFLRAQIARIAAGTVIAPSGFFQVNEGGEIEAAEEQESRSAEQLADLGSWVHFSKEINARYARMTPMPPQTNADGDEVPWDGEEFAPPLKSLAEDTAGAWRVDRYPATLVPAVGEIAVVRSLVWPGAVSLGVGKKFLNIYVGHGVKHSAEPYQRALPLPLQIGFGVAPRESSEGESDGASSGSTLRFEGLVEQKDVTEDPTPPEAEE